jgi:metallo-beta-lactamase family protein
MQLKIKFLGAAGNVTGSRHCLEIGSKHILIDCGLYQERQFRDRNWQPFPVSPSRIEAVMLTHAHLDHCGLLPKLVKEGFSGNIYCTAATAEIAKIILLDSAKIQEEDAEHKRKRHERQGVTPPHPDVPLYTTEDAQKVFPLFKPVNYEQQIKIDDDIKACFYDAGHVLGSSVVKITAGEDADSRSVLFSGDIGRNDRPIVQDPAVLEQADYVLIESTYGDRIHHNVDEIKKRMAEVINEAVNQGGNIIIPSFALERSQEILYYLNQLQQENQIPTLPIFLDSPMASKITEVFKNHPEIFDKEMRELTQNNHSPFNMKNLEMAGDKNDSKAINEITNPVIVIAGSGMCTGGRVKHHLVNNIARPESVVMFVGYQAAGTLGRRLVDGDKEVRILGENYPVNAKIERIHGFSAHADKNELLQWLKELDKPPRTIFVVHGEIESSKKFAEFLREKTGWNIIVPEYQQEIELN